MKTIHVGTSALGCPAEQSPAPPSKMQVWKPVLIALLMLLAAPLSASDSISVQEAGQHIGETRCVTGKVLRVKVGRKGVHFLDFCEDQMACPFSVVVFPHDLKDVGDVPHRVQFVTVRDGTRLEVYSTGGGLGPNIVLLAGSGNTAHIYDDFAPKLTSFCHAYGITRWGFGASSRPESGYSEQRLADDVIRVIDSLRIASPVLLGHSLAGGEITTVAGQHPDRLLRLVYLDAVRDPTRDYSQITKELESAHLHPVTPSDPKDNSFVAYRE